MDEHNLDGIIFTIQCADATPVWFASPAKYPIVTVPLGYDEEIQEPVSLCIVGRPWSEGLLIELM